MLISHTFRCLVAVVVLVTPLAVPSSTPAHGRYRERARYDRRSDLEQMQGKWTLVEFVYHGAAGANRAIPAQMSGEMVITGLSRVSKPGRRVYCKASEVPEVLGGLGINILSTSRGVMSGRNAKARKLGGEILVNVW